MKKTVQTIAKIMTLSVVLLANAKIACDALGANSATWSPSITIKNDSSFDLIVKIETIGDNKRSNWSEIYLAKGGSLDVPRYQLKSITPRERVDGPTSQWGSHKSISDHDSIIKINNSDLSTR